MTITKCLIGVRLPSRKDDFKCIEIVCTFILGDRVVYFDQQCTRLYRVEVLIIVAVE